MGVEGAGAGIAPWDWRLVGIYPDDAACGVQAGGRRQPNENGTPGVLPATLRASEATILVVPMLTSVAYA